jgi:hypothetical protein
VCLEKPDGGDDLASVTGECVCVLAVRAPLPLVASCVGAYGSVQWRCQEGWWRGDRGRWMGRVEVDWKGVCALDTMVSMGVANGNMPAQEAFM